MKTNQERKVAGCNCAACLAQKDKKCSDNAGPCLCDECLMLIGIDRCLYCPGDGAVLLSCGCLGKCEGHDVSGPVTLSEDSLGDDECDCGGGGCAGCDDCHDLNPLGLEDAIGPIVIEPLGNRDDFMKLYLAERADDTEVAEGWCLPQYASEGDSGFDVRSPRDYIIAPGETVLIGLGFKMQIPKHPFHSLGYRYECQCRPRSGVSLKTELRVANAPGTIDNFYTGGVGVILTNTTQADTLDHLSQVPPLRGIDGKPTEPVDEGIAPHGSYLIRRGDRIAQLVFNEIIRPRKFQFGVVVPIRDGGFGSTGTK